MWALDNVAYIDAAGQSQTAKERRPTTFWVRSYNDYLGVQRRWIYKKPLRAIGAVFLCPLLITFFSFATALLLILKEVDFDVIVNNFFYQIIWCFQKKVVPWASCLLSRSMLQRQPYSLKNISQTEHGEVMPVYMNLSLRNSTTLPAGHSDSSMVITFTKPRRLSIPNLPIRAMPGWCL